MNLEQDHYLEYAEAILEGSFVRLPQADLRLFPGLPWILALGGGQVWWGFGVMGIAMGLCWWGINKLTGEKRSILALLFPPIMLMSATVIGTEMVVLAGILWGIIWVKEKKYEEAAAVLGASLWVRLIGGVAGWVIFAWMVYRKKYKEAFRYLLIFILFNLAILLWNVWVFGDPWIQIKNYADYGRPKIGIVQLVEDITRAIDWGWYRQVVSGISYLVLLLFLMVNGWQSRKGKNEMIWWLVVGMVGFIFAIGPTPFLEEFPRFLVPVFPLLYILTFKKWRSWWVWLLPLVSIAVVLI